MSTKIRGILNGILENKSAAITVAALCFATCWVYYDSLWYGFIHSDLPMIRYFVQGGVGGLSDIIFSQPRWVSVLLNKTIYFFYSDTVFYYRLVNLLLHLANGILIFIAVFFSRRLARPGTFVRRYAFSLASLVTLFMLLHPVQSQTVLYIAQMQLEGVVLFFTMLGIVAVQGFAQTAVARRKRGYFLLLLVAALGGTGAKEIAVTMPLLILLYDWFFIAAGRLRNLLTRWYLYATSGGIIAAAFFWYGTLRPGFVIKLAHASLHNDSGNVVTALAQAPITYQPYALSQFKVMLHYLKIFLWPADLCYDYQMVLSYSWQELDVLVPALICVALLVLMVWRYAQRGSNVVSFGLAWFFVAIVPRVSLFPATELVCDYKTYLASFGIMMVLAYLVIMIGRILFLAWPILMACGPRVVKASALASLMYYVGAATLKRELVWQNECAFWQDVVEKAPKPRAINNYAVALWHQGEIDQAVNYFKKAIETDHWYAEPHANLGTIYQVKGDEENALYHYARAVEIDDGHAQLFNNLGQLHVSRGAHEAAELCFKRSIALHATTPNAYLNLAQLYEKQKRDQEALDTYQHACARQLTTPALLYAYGSLAYRMDKLPQAIGAFELLDQGYEQTAYLLGCCYYDQQHYEQAVKNLALASKKDPLNIKYLYHYAQALMHAKHYDEAAAMYSLCMTNDQVFAPASLQKIYCLYSAGHKQLAQQQMASFLEHDLQPHVVEKAVALRQKYLT